MQRKRLEALAEAVVHVSGYREPGSALYQARNPGGLKAVQKKDAKGRIVMQPHDEQGNRVFASVIDGLQALLFDTALKLEGMSRAHLRPTDSLREFAMSHGQPALAANAYAKFLRKALQNDSIHQDLTLDFFLEE